jgi:hypothetical protein
MESSAASETADVQIRFGAVPENLEGAVAKGVLYQARPNHFLLRMDKIAAFLISNGREVLIDRAPEATDDEILLFLFGSAFGALLHQRGLLVLHASAVETARGAALFVGHSGNGKSTLAAALRKRGYRILADDVCSLALDAAGQPVVLPGFPQLKLWADTAKKLEQETEPLRRVRPQLEKFALPVEDGFVNEPRPLFAVYHLTTINKQEFKLEAVEDAKNSASSSSTPTAGGSWTASKCAPTTSNWRLRPGRPRGSSGSRVPARRSCWRSWRIWSRRISRRHDGANLLAGLLP